MTVDITMIESVAWLGTRVIQSLARNVWAERDFYGVMILSLILAFIVDIQRSRNLRRRYGSKGFRTDLVYAAVGLSHIQSLWIIAPFAAALNAAKDVWTPWFQLNGYISFPLWVSLLLALLFKDFWCYWYHRLQHSNRWLWQVHKVHHAQSELTVLTNFRFPVIDILVATVLLLPAGSAMGSMTLPYTLYLLYLLRSFLEHSDTGWTFGPIGKLFVSPAFHETHHSVAPEHRNCNFSLVFPIWDHLFGTFSRREPSQLRYGLATESIPESFIQQLFVPLIGWWRLLVGRPTSDLRQNI